MRKFTVILLGILFVSISSTQAFSDLSTDPKVKTTQDTSNRMPKVFLLGDLEKEYEKLSSEYATSLLEVNDDDFQQAFANWNTLLKEMEAHAEIVDYDIKGIKMWLHVFWDENGKIKHIAYFLKPNSRNVDRAEMSSFLMDFINNYHVPVNYDKKFSHYSGAAFPFIDWKKKKTQLTAKAKSKKE